MSTFSKLIERAMHETSPRRKKPLRETNRFALSWWMENSKLTDNKPKRVMHPSLGEGTVISLNEQAAQVEWDRLSSWTRHGGKIEIEEAKNIIILDEDKYYNERDFAEEQEMTKKIDMTAADYEALLEEGNAPSPRDTVLTSTDKFKSGSDKPLSGLEGEGGTMPMPKPHEEKGAAPKDAPGTPDVDSMDDEPSRKASVKGSAGARKSSSKGAVDSGEEESSDEEAKEAISSYADIDLEGILETDGNPDSMYFDECGDEERVTESHPEGTIAGTPEFMTKLLSAVAKADLDETSIGTVVDAIVATCDADEDRTLDVADIGKVMSKMKEMVNGGGEAPEGNDVSSDEESPEEESYSPGDGEPAGPEAGPEHEGETKLFADDDEEEVEEEAPEGWEGTVKAMKDEDDIDNPYALSHWMKNKGYKSHKKEGKGVTEKGKVPPEFEKNKFKKASDSDDDGDDKTDEEIGDGNQKLDEAWLAGIPAFGPRSIPKKADPEEDGLEIDEEEAELNDIRRLSGLT